MLSDRRYHVRLAIGAALFGLAALGAPYIVTSSRGETTPPVATNGAPSSPTPFVFHVDFSRRIGPPLIKDKFGVYETPFLKKNDLLRAASMLPEAGVQDLRYEMGWGKPDTYADDQIGGTAAAPTIDFSALDPFVGQLKQYGIAPLFALSYDPIPLKSGTQWQRWKDMPSHLSSWQDIARRYAAHYHDALGLEDARYEIWNEPDIPGDGGKMFFNGGPDQYAALYRSGAAGVHAGDRDALAGGPAIAYDRAFAAPILTAQPDFLSIHAYDNYAGQLDGMRTLLAGRPDLPILLTEYASFTSYGPDAPVSRYPAAERFFRDADGLLAYTDVPKVYWAQWVDDSIGLITRDWHRKALFNAFKIYQTMLPIDRSPVTPDAAGGVRLMAASDDHTAGAVLWNESAEPRIVTVVLDRLPFAQGTLDLYRIDGSHASYSDDHSAENLDVQGRWQITASRAQWRGSVPAESVVFLRASDGAEQSLLQTRHIGTFVREFGWYPDRKSGTYADFDPHTSIARLGLDRATGIAQVGAVYNGMVNRLRVQVKKTGSLIPQDADALFGFRLDYGSRKGGYTKSVLWHDGSYKNARRTALPWGKGGATPDKAYRRPEMNSAVPFTIDIASEAPPDWNGRVILTPILQDMGAGSIARIIFSPVPPTTEPRYGRS